MNFWYGLFGPPGMPADVVAKLFDATRAALADPALQQRLATLGYEATPSESTAEFQATGREDAQRMRARIEAAGIRQQ